MGMDFVLLSPEFMLADTCTINHSRKYLIFSHLGRAPVLPPLICRNFVVVDIRQGESINLIEGTPGSLADSFVRLASRRLRLGAFLRFSRLFTES